MLADVIEHLDDPVAAVERCAGLLRPGGVLCVVTPDPSSADRAHRRPALVGLRARPRVPAAARARCASCSPPAASSSPPTCRSCARSRPGAGSSGLAERLGPAGGPVERAGRRAARRRLAEPGAPRRARDPRPPHRRPARAAAAAARPRRRRRRHARPARPTRPRARSPTWSAEIPVDAADRALLVDDASHDDTAEVALAHGFDVIRHPANRGYGAQPEDRLRAGAARRRRRRSSWSTPTTSTTPGLVAEMVAPILAGEADMVIGSRLLRDRAIAGGMPRWKWLGNRLLTGHREPRLRRRALRVPHRLPRLLAPTCCARSRSCATPTTSSSTRRSSPRSWRAARAWSRSRSRRATSARRRASTCATSVRYGAEDARRARALHGRSPPRPLAAAAPHRRRPRRPAPVAMRAARVGVLAVVLVAAALVLRIAYVDATPGLRAAPRRASTTTSTRARSPRATGSPRRSPTAARPRSARPATRTSWAPSTTCSRPTASRSRSASTSRGSPRPSSGRRSSRSSGVIAAQLWGSVAALVALGAGRDLPAADPRRRRGDVRAAVRRLHARLAGGRAGLPALAAPLPLGAARRGRSAGLADPDARPTP